MPICTGPTKSVTRNANASTLPAVRSWPKPPPSADLDADDQHRGVGQPGRDAAEGERDDREPLGAGAGRLVLVDRLVDPLLGAVLDRRRTARPRRRRPARRSPRASRRPGAARRRRPRRACAGSSGSTGRAARSRPRPRSRAASCRRASRSVATSTCPTLTISSRPPKTRNWLTWSTSLVTRETRAPRRSVFWVSTGRSWTWRNALIRSVARPRSEVVNSRRGHQVRRPARQHDRGGREQPHQHREGDVGAAGAVDAAVEGLLHRDRHDDLAGRGQERRARASSPGPPSAPARPPRRGGSSRSRRCPRRCPCRCRCSVGAHAGSSTSSPCSASVS